jgi:chromate transport protein ChrA
MPGAVGMYGLSLGIQQIKDTLPNLVYALLSGLNAATVGIIALAAVQVHPFNHRCFVLCLIPTVIGKGNYGSFNSTACYFWWLRWSLL